MSSIKRTVLDELEEIKTINNPEHIKRILENKKRPDLQTMCESLGINYRPPSGYASKPELINVIVSHFS
jgi:hypothetical protein